MSECKLKTINLKNYYPYYTSDFFIELPEEIVAAMKPYKTEDQSHWRRMRKRHVYSLNIDGNEESILFRGLGPDELYECKLTNQELYNSLNYLSDKQAKRIYAHYLLNMTCAAIAKSEGISECAVRCSISSGLRNLKKYLGNLR